MPNYIETGYDDFLNITSSDTGKITNANVDANVDDETIDFRKTTINVLNVGEQIASSNFKTGVSGWKIDGAGNVEFSNGTFRGDLSAASGTLGTITAGNISGVTITSSTIKTSNVTYPDVLINSSGLTLHGEKLIMRQSDGTLGGYIGGTSTYGVRIVSETNKNIKIESGYSMSLTGYTGQFLSYDGSTGSLSLEPTGNLNLSGTYIYLFNDLRPNADASISIGSIDYRIQNIYVKNLLRITPLTALPSSGNTEGDLATYKVGGVTKLVIYDGSSWVAVGTQT